jgi:hypothetical protein
MCQQEQPVAEKRGTLTEGIPEQLHVSRRSFGSRMPGNTGSAMIMRYTMLNTEISNGPEFWSEEYGGRSIAVFNHHGRWLVYLDHVLQKVMFASSEDAIAWLTNRIDHGVPARLH